MVNYIYKGYGVTDSNGVAHLDHDANGNPINHSYTGVGAGEIDVVASLDNPVSSGSIVSEPYELWDTLLYDDATSTGYKNPNWYYGSGITEDVTENGTIITASADYNYYTLRQTITSNHECIFEVKSTGGATRVGYIEPNTSNYILYTLPVLSNFVYCKLTKDSNGVTCKYSSDRTIWTDATIVTGSKTDLGSYWFEFSPVISGRTMTFKNLKVYSI